MTLADDDCRTITTQVFVPAAWGEATRLLVRAVTALPFLPREGATPGYRVFASDDTRLWFCDVVEGTHAVVGRHSGADLVLDDPSLALRQLVLRVGRNHDGRLELRVHDLRTHLSFYVGPVAWPRRAFAATGPLTLRVGTSVLFALPFTGCIWRTDASPLLADAAVELADADVPGEDEALSIERAVDAATNTVVRALEPMTPLSSVEASCEPAWLKVVLRGPRRRLAVGLSRLQLAAPVLIGRYERCDGRGPDVLSTEVSRVHAAIIREGDSVVVLDLASTNGLVVKGRAARAVRVRHRASIQLGYGPDRLDLALTHVEGR